MITKMERTNEFNVTQTANGKWLLEIPEPANFGMPPQLQEMLDKAMQHLEGKDSFLDNIMREAKQEEADPIKELRGQTFSFDTIDQLASFIKVRIEK